MKDSLRRSYRDFKRECTLQLIWAAKNPATGALGLVDELAADQSAFRAYFNQDRWHEAANGFEDDRHHRYLEDACLAAMRLKSEIDFVLDQADLDDERFVFFKGFSEILGQLARTTREYDGVKSMFRVLWSVFTGYSFAEGYKTVRDRTLDEIEAI